MSEAEAPPPPQSNSMTAIADIPIADITGNKRHTTMYTTPPQLAVVTAPPAKEPPSNLPTSPPVVDPSASYKVESVTKKTSRSNEAKGTMYALLTEKTMASQKNSYSEKVALFTKEATFAQDGEQEEPTAEEPTSTAMVSVDDEVDDDVVQGEVVSSQMITSR